MIVFLCAFSGKALDDVPRAGGVALLLWILQRDDVVTRERLAAQQVLPVLRLDVELVDGFPGVNVSRRPNRDNARVVRENLLDNSTDSCGQRKTRARGPADELDGALKVMGQWSSPAVFL